MTADELRAFCLALDGAVETFPFAPGTSVFKNDLVRSLVADSHALVT